MPDRRLMVLLGTAVMMVISAGCSEARSGSPTPGNSATPTTTEPSTTTTSSGSTDRHGAPRAEVPLDAAQYLTEPCSAVSPRLLQTLGLPGQGKPDTTSAVGRGAPSCDWRAGAELVGVAFLKGNRNGLADLYRQEEVFHDAKYWEPTTVEGYPGVFHSTVDSRSQGQCNLSVGLNDALAMSVNESGQLGAASCERAARLAEAVIKTLKGQG